MNKTPLRYPGGKAKFTRYFVDFLKKENIRDGIFVEPFCGGAGAAINLLLCGEVSQIYINDIDRSIYAFWHSVLNDSGRLIRKIKRTLITLEEFDKQKKVQVEKSQSDLFDLGFSTFFLNRTTFSGIISGGPIGGRSQSGGYKLDCRFNKEDLVKRIENIAKHRKHVRVFNKDAKDFLNLRTIKKLPRSKTIFYVDPPYFEKGVLLYQDNFDILKHKELEKVLRSYGKYMCVSYDNCKEIKDIYASWYKHEVDVPHCAGKFKIGKEIILQR